MRDESSNALNWALSDRRNLTIAILLIIMATLALAVLIGAYSVTHEDSPYELRSDADATSQELRNRINLEVANQHIVNADVANQLVGIEDRLDDLDNDMVRLLHAAGMSTRRYKKK